MAWNPLVWFGYNFNLPHSQGFLYWKFDPQCKYTERWWVIKEVKHMVLGASPSEVIKALSWEWVVSHGTGLAPRMSCCKASSASFFCCRASHLPILLFYCVFTVSHRQTQLFKLGPELWIKINLFSFSLPHLWCVVSNRNWLKHYVIQCYVLNICVLWKFIFWH